MEELKKYKARLFAYAKNRTIRFMQDNELIGFLLSDVQTELRDSDIKFTDTPLLPCIVSDGEKTEDFIIEKEDLCRFLESRVQSFKAALIAKKIRLAFGEDSGSQEKWEILESESTISLEKNQNYVQIEESGRSIPAVYEFNYNFFFLRAVIKDNKPWFVSYDIFQKILELGRAEEITEVLPPEDKQICPIKSLSMIKDMEVISKEGMETLLTRLSNITPEAIKLKKWIDKTVLPELDSVISSRIEANRKSQEKLHPAVKCICSIKMKRYKEAPPINLYECKGEYWLERTQIGALLGYAEPRKVMQVITSRHPEQLDKYITQQVVLQEEGNRTIRRNKTMISVNGLQALYKLIKDLRKKEILHDLGIHIGKAIQKEI